MLSVIRTRESWKIPVLQPVPETEKAVRKSKLMEAQIAFILKQAGEGTSRAEVCRKAWSSDVKFYGWHKKYAGLTPSAMKRLRVLKEVNGRLKKLLADVSLDKAMI